LASTFATATGEYEKAFWTNIYTKPLPPLVAGDKIAPLSVIHSIERIIVEHHTLPDDRALLPPTFQNDVMAQRSELRRAACVEVARNPWNGEVLTHPR
jgi:hypothetical protein